MNFKPILLVCLLCFGCGVKGPPRPPAGTAVPSYLDNYLKNDDQSLTETQEEKSKSEKKKKVAK